MEETASIVQHAHKVARDRHAQEGGQDKPIMGHDVLVSFLWQIRNLWELLVPSHGQDPKGSFAKASFVSYENIHQYRDFLIKCEDGSTPSNRRVGLWAKQFMTDPEYKYISTLATKEMYDSVVGVREPDIAAGTSKDARKLREDKVASALRKLTTGPYKEQFSPQRLADAIAVLEHNWRHFIDHTHAIPDRRRELPSALAARMRRRGHLNDNPDVSRQASLASLVTELRSNNPSMCAPPRASPTHQRAHELADLHGVRRGDGVNTVAVQTQPPKTDTQFLARPVIPGSYVLTAPARYTPLAKLNKPLQTVKFWVWKVLRVFEPGASLESNNRGVSSVQERVFEAQVYCSVDKNATDMKQPLGPCFDKFDRKLFLRNPHERAHRDDENAWSDHAHKPLTVFLRSCNILGGGFRTHVTYPCVYPRVCRASGMSVESMSPRRLRRLLASQPWRPEASDIASIGV